MAANSCPLELSSQVLKASGVMALWAAAGAQVVSSWLDVHRYHVSEPSGTGISVSRAGQPGDCGFSRPHSSKWSRRFSSMLWCHEL
jgi:hypothetical protein